MATTYNQFGSGDIVPNVKQVITSAIWSTTSGSLYSYYTSSTQSASTGDYYYDVYQEDPDASPSLAQVQFAIAYGHRFGSGSSQISDSAGDESLTPSRAIYSQYRNFLLSQTTDQFTVGTRNTDQIIAINFQRARSAEKIDPGNWEMTTSGSGAYSKLSFIDDSTVNTTPTVGEGGTVYNIVSGTIEDGVFNTDAPHYYGLMYPEHSLLIYDAIKMAATGGLAIVSASNTDGDNHAITLNAIATGSELGTDFGFKARNEEKISSTYYFVRIRNADYNFTTNPSFYTGSLGELRHNEMIDNPQTYITAVGLYNDNNEMMAVAKLSQPLRKNFNREALLRCRIDF